MLEKRINVINTKKLEEAIKKAEGRATARTVDVRSIILCLDLIKVPKARLNGTKVEYDGGEKFPNAYKYRPESTHWKAENVNGRWYITDIWRDTCPNRSTSMHVEYSEAAKAWILEEASKF